MNPLEGERSAIEMKLVTPLIAVFFVAALSATTGTPINSTQIDIFADLDDFSLVMVFDWLSFPDLAIVASLHPRYHEIIDTHNIARFKLNEGRVRVWLSSTRFSTIYHFGSLKKVARNYDETLNVLKLFGYLFEEIEFNLAYMGSEAIFKEVFSSDALYTFPNARHVTVNNENEAVYHIQIDRVFPSIEHLKLGGSIVPVTGHSENLKHFSSEKTIEHIDDLLSFLRVNRQLESFQAAMNWDHFYLQELSEILPNLEQLNLKFLYSQKKAVKPTQEIQFKNEKNYTLTIDYDDYRIDEAAHDTFASIVFDHLESFTLNADIHGRKILFMDLIVRNRDLTHVQFEKFGMTEQTWLYLVAELPNLPQVTIKNPDRAEVWDMMRFFQARRSLERVLVTTDASGGDLFRQVEGELWLGVRPYRLVIAEHANEGNQISVTFERNEGD